MTETHAEQTGDEYSAALAWIARLRNDSASDQDRADFALWLAGSPERRQAMDSMLDLWADLGVVRELSFSPQQPARAANQSNWWLGSAVAAAACLVVAVLLWPMGQRPVDTIEFRTAIGERRSFELQDSSRLNLNTNSRVTVRYADDQRQLTLAAGEAFFEVAADADRPFHVDAGSARVTAIGTAFNIRRVEHSTQVTVTEGVVRVTELGASGNRAPRQDTLRANQRLVASSEGLGTAEAVTDNRNLAWRTGNLVADNMPLRELAAEIERYHDKRILIADRDLAALSVSGVFSLDHPETILQAVALTLDLELRPLDEQRVQLLKASR